MPKVSVFLHTVIVVLASGLLSSCAHGEKAASSAEGVTVRVFDVGYGDAILVTAGETNVLVDTGPAAAPLVAKLRGAGVRGLDAVILSHPHPDHAGGLAAVVQSGVPVHRILHNPDEAWPRVAGWSSFDPSRRTAVTRDTPAMTFGSLRLTFLHPDGATYDDPNNASLVVLIEAGGTALLFPGDVVDVEIQARLCERVPHRLAALKLPHHGDRTAPCLGDRAAVHLVSVARNPWGVPRAETLSRHADRIRRTDLEGDLLLEFPAPPGK